MEFAALGFLNDDNSTAKIIQNLHYEAMRAITEDHFSLGRFIAIFESAYQKLINNEEAE